MQLALLNKRGNIYILLAEYLSQVCIFLQIAPQFQLYELDTSSIPGFLQSLIGILPEESSPKISSVQKN